MLDSLRQGDCALLSGYLSYLFFSRRVSWNLLEFCGSGKAGFDPENLGSSCRGEDGGREEGTEKGGEKVLQRTVQCKSPACMCQKHALEDLVFSLTSHCLGNFRWLLYFTWVLTKVFFQIPCKELAIFLHDDTWILSLSPCPSGLKFFITLTYQTVLSLHYKYLFTVLNYQDSFCAITLWKFIKRI